MVVQLHCPVPPLIYLLFNLRGCELLRAVRLAAAGLFGRVAVLADESIGPVGWYRSGSARGDVCVEQCVRRPGVIFKKLGLKFLKIYKSQTESKSSKISKTALSPI